MKKTILLLILLCQMAISWADGQILVSIHQELVENRAYKCPNVLIPSFKHFLGLSYKIKGKENTQNIGVKMGYQLSYRDVDGSYNIYNEYDIVHDLYISKYNGLYFGITNLIQLRNYESYSDQYGLRLGAGSMFKIGLRPQRDVTFWLGSVARADLFKLDPKNHYSKIENPLQYKLIQVGFQFTIEYDLFSALKKLKDIHL